MKTILGEMDDGALLHVFFLVYFKDWLHHVASWVSFSHRTYQGSHIGHHFEEKKSASFKNRKINFRQVGARKWSAQVSERVLNASFEH